MKSALRRIVLLIVAMAFSTFISIVVMIKGWGLEPQSWWWIIGVYWVGHLLAAAVGHLAKDD